MKQDPQQGLDPSASPEIGQPNPMGRWVNERGLLLATGEATQPLYEALLSQRLGELEDIIPADGSLLLVVKPGASISQRLRSVLATPQIPASAGGGTLHEIAVEYGGTAGPDLQALAAQAGMDASTYVDRHAAVAYRVAFLGFQPGFAYLRGLPAALHAPRRASPRVQVPAGSVAVGGAYTGIYPASGPGGWHIIGRTTADLFDPERNPPALLMPGDRVRLLPR